MTVVSWIIIAKSFSYTLPDSLPLPLGPRCYQICIYVASRSVNPSSVHPQKVIDPLRKADTGVRLSEHRHEGQSPYLLVGKGITENYSTETQNDLMQSGHQNRLIWCKFEFVGSKGRDDGKFMGHVELLRPSTWDMTEQSI